MRRCRVQILCNLPSTYTVNVINTLNKVLRIDSVLSMRYQDNKAH
jgi:hypothetical protein